jgi:hypothetical protein
MQIKSSAGILCGVYFPDRIGGGKTRRTSRREGMREECQPLAIGVPTYEWAQAAGYPLDVRPAVLVH